MIYALVIYIVFLAIYGQWSDNSVNWQVIYFAFQYGFAGAVSLLNKGIKFIVIGLIFAVLTVNELSYINASLEDYETAWSVTPVYWFTFAIIIIFICYEIYMKWKRR
jgi:hypothetical protein